MPFVCKWLGTHSDPQHFETEEKLRNHIIQHDINSCKRSILGDPIYIYLWKGCNKYQSSIIKLEGIKIFQVFFGFVSCRNNNYYCILQSIYVDTTKTVQGIQYLLLVL